MSSAVGNALGQVGQTIADAPGNLYDASGLANVGAGLQSLFGDGSQAIPPSEFVGPPSPYQAPNFLQGFTQGLLGHDPNRGIDVPTAGGQVGGGLGQLLNFLDRIQQQSRGLMPAASYQPGGGGQGAFTILPGYHQAVAPSGGFIHGLLSAYGLGGAITPG